MNINSFLYQLRIKRAILEAHVAAMSNTIDDIEYQSDDEYAAASDDYRVNEEAVFEKYWKIVSEID